jgi:glycosyltransferase involved in cell wall biosynthesis
MRILMMMSSLAMGGGEKTVLALMPQLRALNHEVSLLTMNTRRDSALVNELQEIGIQRLDLAAKRMIDFAAWQRFTGIIKNGNFDIIHPQDQDTIIFGALAHRQLGIPAVMTRHVMVEPDASLKQWLRAKLLLFAAKHGYNKIVTVSDAVKQRFHEITRIPVDLLETVYNGLEFAVFNTLAERETIRAAEGWGADEQIITMVAVLRAGKGHEILFAAAPLIKAKFPNARIKLVGGGELEAELRQQAAAHMDIIEFMGQRNDVPRLLGGSDMLVLPSWSEALPTVLMEAGAVGLPVVATDVGGTREIVIDGKTGYVVDAGDVAAFAQRICDLLANPDAARGMGQTAKELISGKFTLEKQAESLIKLYEGVIRTHENRL